MHNKLTLRVSAHTRLGKSGRWLGASGRGLEGSGQLLGLFGSLPGRSRTPAGSVSLAIFQKDQGAVHACRQINQALVDRLTVPGFQGAATKAKGGSDAGIDDTSQPVAGATDSVAVSLGRFSFAAATVID